MAAVLLGGWAAPARAASHDASDLADGVVAGVTADLDADGAREIVAVIAGESGQDLVVWREADDGWEAIGDVPVAGFASGGSGVRPLAADDGSGLLLVNDGPRERAILATVPSGGGSVNRCCLSLFEVIVASGDPEVRPIAPSIGLASSIESADLDADGRDELIVQAPIDPTGPEPPFEAVRILWLGDGSVVEEPVLVPEDAGFLVAVGDSDGVPGDDLHFLAGGVVTRWTAVGSDHGTETGVLPNTTAGLAGQWIAGATGGALVTVDATGRVVAVRWPRAEAPLATASVTTGAFASVFVLGEGEDARILAMESAIRTEQPRRTSVYGLDLRLEALAEPSPAIEAMVDLSSSDRSRLGPDALRPWPQFGPLGAPPGGGAAFLLPGSLLVLASDGELASGTTVPFAGEGSMGLAGADGRWVVSGLGWNSYAGRIAALSGGVAGTRLSVVPLDELVGSAAGSPPDLDVRSGALVDDAEPPVLYVGDAGLALEVRAGPGARAFALAGSDGDVSTVTAGAVMLSLRPDAGPDDGAPARTIVVVVEPGGVAHVADWETVVLDGPPELRVTSSGEPFQPTSTISGAVAGPVRVMIDGAPARVRADGTFAAEVDAPIWGREVRVTAVDPVGQTSSELITAIGFLDYRTLPWLPIFGAVTVLIGVALFVRTPGAGVARGRPAEGDGRLEELDPDRS